MPNEKWWTDKIAAKLVGRTIKSVGYLTQEEADEMGWSQRPIALELDDGAHLFPSRDDEGNDGGSIFTSYEDLDIIPVI